MFDLDSMVNDIDSEFGISLENTDASNDSTNNNNSNDKAKGNDGSDTPAPADKTPTSTEDAAKEQNVNKAEESALNACALLDYATSEEIAQCAESADEQAAVSELMGIAMEKTIVRLDRKARMKHLTKAATIQAARKAGDPKFKKLMTLWKMERAIEKYFEKKYHTAGMKVAKEKIKNYSANGVKKIPPKSDKVVGKGHVASKIAQRAVSQSKQMFGNQKNK